MQLSRSSALVRGRRPAMRLSLGVGVLLLAMLLVAMSTGAAGQLWDQQAGDNANLLSMFAPPPGQQQQQQGPAQQQMGLDMWQQQQAAGGMMQQPQQRQQQATMPTSNILTELAVALLRVAQQQQQPQQQQQQQQPMMQQQQGMMQPNNPFAMPSPPQQQRAPQQQQQSGGGNLAFTEQRSSTKAADLFPVSRPSAGGYGFSVPPADVQAARRRAIPRPISDLQRFASIPNRSRASLRQSMRKRGRVQSLDDEFRRRPARRIPPPPAQRTFHLRTQHRRPSALEQIVSRSAMKRVVSGNPFDNAVEAARDSGTEITVMRSEADQDESGSVEDDEAMLQTIEQELDLSASPALLAFETKMTEARQPATPANQPQQKSQPPAEQEQPRKEAEELDLSSSPAMLAFSAKMTEVPPAAEAPKQSAAQDKSLMEREVEDLGLVEVAAQSQTAASVQAKVQAHSKARSSVRSRRTGSLAPRGEFTRAVPSANFSDMFKSIMRARKTQTRADREMDA